MDVERARLLKHTRELVAKGQQAEHIWHAATHVEHVRPMLQVRSWQAHPPQSPAASRTWQQPPGLEGCQGARLPCCAAACNLSNKIK